MPTSGWTNAATTKLQDDGFGLVPQLISTSSHEALVKLIDSAPEASWERRGDGTAFAIRNAHLKVEGLLTALTGAGVIAFIEQLLGQTPLPVSATVFDKPEGAKWSVPAHQDIIHPLLGSGPTDGFRNWSVRDGVNYARLPDAVLDKMIALRLHLDACLSDGALQVIPRTHHQTLPADAVMDSSPNEFVACPGAVGSALVLRPRLIHRSGPSGEGSRRRVLHLVFSSVPLPNGLAWTWDA